jgi:hypothetical protein
MPHFRERPNYARPPSRTRRRRIPSGFGAPVADALTDTDILLSLPPQIRRAIMERREGMGWPFAV